MCVVQAVAVLVAFAHRLDANRAPSRGNDGACAARQTSASTLSRQCARRARATKSCGESTRGWRPGSTRDQSAERRRSDGLGMTVGLNDDDLPVDVVEGLDALAALSSGR
jgi:hypothetical protein